MQKHNLPCLSDIDDLSGKKVLLRAALNVPVADGVVRDPFRLLRARPTIEHLQQQGARVVIAGHIGRDPQETLEPIYKELKKSIKLSFSGDVAGADTRNMIDEMKDGDVLLLENVRRDPREKQNDAEFARELASLADIYINDAFADSHREHASIVGVPLLLPSFVGLSFKNEYEELAHARKPKSPSLFLLGGAKFETKMPLIEQFLDIYDHVFIGGALANDFFRAKGLAVGQSLVSDIDLSESDIISHKKILLPVDVTVSDGSSMRVTTPDDVKENETIMDIGPESTKMLADYIKDAKTILWNGPFGNYEKGFSRETEAGARLIAEASGYSVVGGGDTVASIASLNLQEHFGFLSTAGGAMLTFLEHGTLPGIEAIERSEK